MCQKIVVGVTGEIGAGKDEAAQYLTELAIKDNLTSRMLGYSDYLTLTLREYNIPETRENLQDLGRLLVTMHPTGSSIDHRVRTAINDEITEEFVGLTGVRYLSNVETLRSFPQNRFLYVTAPAEIRHARIRNRKQKLGEEHLSDEDMIRLDNKPTEMAVREIIHLADSTIINDGTLEDFHRELDKFWEEQVVPFLQ